MLVRKPMPARGELEGDEDHLENSKTMGVEAIPNLFVIPESTLGTNETTLAILAVLGILTLHNQRLSRE